MSNNQDEELLFEVGQTTTRVNGSDSFRILAVDRIDPGDSNGNIFPVVTLCLRDGDDEEKAVYFSKAGGICGAGAQPDSGDRLLPVGDEPVIPPVEPPTEPTEPVEPPPNGTWPGPGPEPEGWNG